MTVFVCSSYGGLEENYFRAMNYCGYVIEKGGVPICPATMYHGILDDRSANDHEQYLTLNRELAKICDEIWVFGNADGGAVNAVSGLGKEIKYIRDTFRFNKDSEMLSVLCRTYETMTGKLVNRFITDSMLYYINQGQSDKLVIAAIKIAANKSLGWNYAEGILKRCLSQGINTLEEFEQQNQRKSDEDFSTYDLDLFEQMLNAKD